MTNSDETNIVEKRSSLPSDTRSDTVDTMNKERIAEEGRVGTSTAEAL